MEHYIRYYNTHRVKYNMGALPPLEKHNLTITTTRKRGLQKSYVEVDKCNQWKESE